MARVLLLTPQLPYPPHQGTTLRNYYILRWLAEEHDVTLLSATEAPGNGDLDVIRPFCAEIRLAPAESRGTAGRLRDLISSELPDLALRVYGPALEAALAALLRAAVEQGEPYDVVQIEGLELGQAIAAVRRESPASNILLDEHNAEAALQRRAFARDIRLPRRWIPAVYSLLQSGRLRRFEAWACRTADAVVAVSRQDAQALQQLAPEASVAVIPNFVDVTRYAERDGGPRQAYDLLFTGKMDYRPNVDAVTWLGSDIWPKIRAARPGSSLAIVGQKPAAAVARLARLPGVTVTGAVDEVQPYLHGASVYVVPVRMASGTRLKLLEAMASGRAIVTTSAGGEGFPVEDGRELIVADSAADFARAVLALLDDPERRADLGTAARAFASGYDWRAVVPQFGRIYRSWLKEAGSDPSDSD